MVAIRLLLPILLASSCSGSPSSFRAGGAAGGQQPVDSGPASADSSVPGQPAEVCPEVVAEEGWVSMDEAWTSLNLADLRCEHDGNIDQRCYRERFDSLDANGDGTISATEAARGAEERNCFNLTRADIKAGLALAS